jgi:hypothetical protein
MKITFLEEAKYKLDEAIEYSGLSYSVLQVHPPPEKFHNSS